MGEEDVFAGFLGRYREEKITHHMDEGDAILSMAEKDKSKENKITHHLDEGDVFLRMLH